MQVNEIKVGVTYTGALDYKRCLGGYRTPFDVDTENNLVLFRVEVGAKPPECYVSIASMKLDEFADWAQDQVQ